MAQMLFFGEYSRTWPILRAFLCVAFDRITEEARRKRTRTETATPARMVLQLER